MTALEDQLTRHLRRTADGVHASWDHAASRVERRARERARRRTTARIGAAVAAGAATVAGLAAVTGSPAGLAPAAGPGTTLTTPSTPGTPTAPRFVLGGRTPTHATSDVGATDLAVTTTFTVYRRSGATGPADPYVMAVTASSKEYSVFDGELREDGEHRSIGWTVGEQVIDVRSFGVSADELGRLAPQLKERRDALPTAVEGWERVEVRWQGAATRHDSISYDSVAPGDTIEIHNMTGVDLACLIDDRLSQPHTTERVTVAGHDAILIDVSSSSGAPRFWVAWRGSEGLTELDLQGVPRDQVGSILANVVALDPNSYDALLTSMATKATAATVPDEAEPATAVTGVATTTTAS